MPKQTIKIKDFARGLNQLNDPRDIPSNAFAELDSVNIDDPGRIRLSGGPANNSADGYCADYDIETAPFNAEKEFLGMIKPGTGLFQTGTDNEVFEAPNNLKNYTKVDNATVTGMDESIAKAANNMTFLATGYSGGAVQNKVSIYDHNANDWYLDLINLNNSTVSDSELSNVLMYNIKGGIRFIESNFNLTGGRSKVFQYIERTHFDDGVHGNKFKGWFTCNQDITKDPEASGVHQGAVGVTTNLTVTNVGNGGSVSHSDEECEKINVYVIESTNGNAFGWNNTVTGVNWNVGISFIYDDGQESPLEISSTNIAIASGMNVKFRLYVTPNESGPKWLNPRLKGINVYVKGTSASSAQSNNWFLAGIFEFDKNKGGKRPQDDTWDSWTKGSGQYYYAETGLWASPPSVETFRTRTGRRPNESVTARYKCAVEARGRMYIGNVYHAEDVGGTEIAYPDRMLKSKRVNGKVSPDIFASSELVDLANNDGEEITHLAYFMGRILQFKQNTLYVVNVAGAAEALESTHKNIGVTHSSQVCTTASGIIWACEKGLMLYNGQSIVNLIDSNISSSTWSSFFDISKIPVLGYDSNDAKVLIVNGSEYATARDMYIYDLKLKAFIFKKDGVGQRFGTTMGTGYLSNMITDFNGNLVWYQSYTTSDNHINTDGSKLLKWDNSPSSSAYFNVVTKDIDFEEPSVRKKMYKVYITYKCSSADTNVIVQYATDGSQSWKQFATDRASDMATAYTTNSINYAELDGSKSVWTQAELRPVTASEANNFKSIQLKISGNRGITAGTVGAAGTGYSAGVVTLTGGSGAGAKATVTVGGSGEITGITSWTAGESSPGTGYALGDSLTVSGGNGAGRITVSELNAVPSNFEINDITIVYRGKRVK